MGELILHLFPHRDKMKTKLRKAMASKMLIIVISIVGVIIFFVIVLLLSQKYLPGLWEGLTGVFGNWFKT